MSQKFNKSQRRPTRAAPPAPPRGPALLIGLGVLLLGVVGLLAWRSASQAAAHDTTGTPRLKADKQRVDLGDVRLGETVSVSFEVTNTGDATLKFTEAPYVEVVEGC